MWSGGRIPEFEGGVRVRAGCGATFEVNAKLFGAAVLRDEVPGIPVSQGKQPLVIRDDVNVC
jgi:hypothetical protein